ncbi:Os06g0268201 [Oryza sativa Japonica Group]|uniref:Os06g0268201 protein n=1 Tax=Oryza sativa subsp. japonica TaxID=39947 RepID=A0A0P0WVF3_ORYSJ|nr:Os06g0268201 [Oryza sativa Japonica Group]
MGVRRGRRIPSIRRRRRWARRCAARSAAPVDLAAAQVEMLPSAGEQGRGKPEEWMRDGRAAMGGDAGGGSGRR